MASNRTALTDEQFLVEMEARGASRDTTLYLRNWLAYAYRGSLKPAPSDRIYDLHVLGDDASFLVMEYFEHLGESVPKELDGSAFEDPSLAELGRWLESFRTQ